MIILCIAMQFLNNSKMPGF